MRAGAEVEVDGVYRQVDVNYVENFDLGRACAGSDLDVAESNGEAHARRLIDDQGA